MGVSTNRSRWGLERHLNYVNLASIQLLGVVHLDENATRNGAMLTVVETTLNLGHKAEVPSARASAAAAVPPASSTIKVISDNRSGCRFRG